jgi:hypothetical protein
MMGNISGTKVSRRFAGIRVSTLALIGSGTALFFGASWAAVTLVTLAHREIVTVRLAQVMGEFVEAEAKSGASPDASRAHVAAYLGAVETAVQVMGKDGRTVLVAEAVVAGSARDATAELKREVAKALAQPAQTGGPRHDH